MTTALREVLADFGVDFDDKNLRKGNRQVDKSAKGLRKLERIADKAGDALMGLGAVLGAGLLVRGLENFVEQTIAIGDNLDKTSQQVGLTTQELQAYSHAAELGGVDSAAFANGMGQLQRKAYDASTGLKEAADSFEALGINVLGADGELKSGSQLLREVADGLQNTSNSSVRTALSMELMGRSGRRLLPMLTGGSEGLAAMAGELEELGGGASEQMIRQSVELTDNLTRFRMRLLSIRSALATRFLPLIDRSVRVLGRFSEKLADILEDSHLLKAGLIALGATAASVAVLTIGTWGVAAATFATVALLVGALALAIDDLYVTAEGGDSVTRRFMEWAFGAEHAAQMVRNMNQAVEDLRNTLASVGGFLGFEIGEEGTDRRRASDRGAEARTDLTGSSWFQTAAQVFTSGRQQFQDAPQLSESDQRELNLINNGRLAQRNRRRAGRQEGANYFADRFPDLVESERSIPGISQQGMSFQPTVATAPAAPTTQAIDSSIGEVTINITESGDTQQTRRVVRQELRSHGDRQRREIQSVVERGDQ